MVQIELVSMESTADYLSSSGESLLYAGRFDQDIAQRTFANLYQFSAAAKDVNSIDTLSSLSNPCR